MTNKQTFGKQSLQKKSHRKRWQMKLSIQG